MTKSSLIFGLLILVALIGYAITTYLSTKDK